MKTIAKILFAPVLICLLSFSFYFSTWKIDKNYIIAFDTKGASGTIAGLSGVVNFSPNTLNSSKIDVSVDVNTLDAGLSLKSKHAKNDGFLNAEKYPKITFKSSSFVKSGDSYLVRGDLTIKATTKRVEIPFTFVDKGQSGEFNGQFQINRTDYNLEKWGIGEVLDIDIKLPVSK
ncbi:YceI family protein [Sphingobacterium corticis]|uniref:YceI family protein n=1 Tax=Sphingobacterium corticis TaxID=1812823 RepID=A0ABW5NJX6_9SPHI